MTRNAVGLRIDIDGRDSHSSLNGLESKVEYPTEVAYVNMVEVAGYHQRYCDELWHEQICSVCGQDSMLRVLNHAFCVPYHCRREVLGQRTWVGCQCLCIWQKANFPLRRKTEGLAIWLKWVEVMVITGIHLTPFSLLI